MNRLVCAVFMILSLAAQAWERVGADSRMIDAHLRVAAREGARFGIRVAVGDTVTWRTFAVEIPDAWLDELDGRIYAGLSIGHCEGGREAVDSSFTVPLFASDGRVPEMSVKVTHFEGRANVCLGEKYVSFRKDFPIDCSQPVFVDFFTDKKTKVLRRTVRSEVLPMLEMSPFATVDDALNHVAASADPMERVWNYYDTTTMPLGVTVGRGYRLVSVASDGGYDLVLIGSDSSSARVRPLMIKGRLLKSDFRDIYNLDWRDSEGRSVCPDASAKFENNMLTLFFPYWDVSVRFSSKTK